MRVTVCCYIAEDAVAGHETASMLYFHGRAWKQENRLLNEPNLLVNPKTGTFQEAYLVADKSAFIPVRRETLSGFIRAWLPDGAVVEIDRRLWLVPYASLLVQGG